LLLDSLFSIGTRWSLSFASWMAAVATMICTLPSTAACAS
jgi:hypothetical protein